jgi:hypothetical protein
MIVTDDNVHEALKYLALDPHPIALARKDVTDAETNAKTIFARLLLASKQTSVATKEADATQDPDYLEAKANENTAIFDLERHKRRTAAAEMLIEVWRSENANVRAAERVR